VCISLRAAGNSNLNVRHFGNLNILGYLGIWTFGFLEIGLGLRALPQPDSAQMTVGRRIHQAS
jgi:hypothetical protein